MFYVINASGSVVASASGPVNTDDLALSGAIAVNSELSLRPDEVGVEGFPAAPRIVAKPPRQLAQLKISSTATDDDGDGLPELRANGKDNTTITVEASVSESLPVTFRTTAGRLSARVVDLEEGKASVQFTAGRETVAVTITAAVPGFADARLEMELVP
ncbi:MAG: hypothetical protein QOE82_1523 [Thermoanaerobaculia bacterium]|jgi:hypothetical protein|nr:hypothetical protein [Thermoanaerobaculia bacterium]